MLQAQPVTTTPVDDDTTPDPAAVIGAVIDSPSFSHMIFDHFLLYQVLWYGGIDACLTQNGIYMALSEKIIALKKCSFARTFCRGNICFIHGRQDPEYLLISFASGPVFRSGNPVRRSPCCQAGHTAFASCTILLPSFISAMLWVTIITVLSVSCRMT